MLIRTLDKPPSLEACAKLGFDNMHLLETIARCNINGPEKFMMQCHAQ